MERHRGDRDRERDFRDRDRNFNHQPRRPSRFSDGPPVDHRRSPGGFRGGRRAFDSPPRQSESDAFQVPMGGGPPPGGFWPMGGDVGGGHGGGFGNDFHGPPRPMVPPVAPPSLSGQKRGFPFSGRGGSPERFDGKGFVKLFVGSVPRTVTEEEIRPLFEEQGNVLEVALIKDKRTGEQQGCCFIKYATSEDADRAIKALHNQYTLPGGIGPIQVRYADGERERLGSGAVEYKLFVGSLNRLAVEKEVEEIFAPYGRIEDVYLMRDERKQSRGCGFVKFSDKDSAMAAINALHGKFTMKGCDQPLIVRFADPKRPRAGDSRTGPTSGGPGFGPSPPPGIRPAGPNFPGQMGGRGPPNSWQPSPQNVGPPVGVGYPGFGNQFPRSGDAVISLTPGAHGPKNNLEGSTGVAVSAASPSPQNFNQPYPQAPPSGQQISPIQKPLDSPQNFPPPIQLHQGQSPYSQPPTSQTSFQPPTSQTGFQPSYTQPFPSQQLPPTQFHTEQNVATSLGNSQQQPVYQQSSSQITQMLSQQRQNLQASFQSSKMAFSQLQQQAQMMHPSIQNQPVQQNYQGSRPQWASPTPMMATSTPALTPPSEIPSTSSAPPTAGSSAAIRPPPVKCDWTEHTSPDGYKYYYNSVTGESRWLKPEELTLYEQQQKIAVQLPPNPNQPSLQAGSNQQVNQSQPLQIHSQFRYPDQFQNPQLSSMYQAPRVMGNMVAQEATYPQAQTPANTVNNAHYQHGAQVGQDWGWKSNTGGT